MRFSFFIHSTYFIFNNTGSTTEIPGSDSPFLSRVEPGSVTPARRLIGSRQSAVCSWQQSWDSCSVWRAPTSVITAASLCEPVAAKTQQALYCQHVTQKREEEDGHLTHTATALRTLGTKYTFTLASVNQTCTIHLELPSGNQDKSQSRRTCVKERHMR